ncbi:hypothetical protein MKY25_13730 [Geobacillus sp. FSL W8-0032]|uniref:Uncharacterized protein n=1 Tax=Geobacillus icigianus TaxID=1430331 RepID=A0ABU6BBM4_9BACL|nr:hypothetical protein [Geobacillus icigianus]MEB3749222.1 hypothetical protein [Geobacillus icigianus]
MAHHRSDRELQLQQKLIHYRSELIQWEQRWTELQQQLEKERLRTEYWRQKAKEWKTSVLNEYEQTIALLQQELLRCQVALEEQAHQPASFTTDELRLHAFFRFSVMLPSHLEEPIWIIGDLIMDNIGTAAADIASICLTVTPKQAGSLSGKIASSSLSDPDQQPGWVFVHSDWQRFIREKGEYWIRPAAHRSLAPRESLIFPSFQIRVNHPLSAPLRVAATVYCAQSEQGIEAVNPLIIQPLS